MMCKGLLCIGVVLLTGIIPLFAASQEGGFPTDVELYNLYQQSGQKKISKKDPQKVVDETQAMFIKDFFLQPFFSAGNEIRGEEDEEDEMGLSKQQNEVYNEMLSTELARQLARKDMLKMRKMLQKSINKETVAAEARQR